MNEFRDVFDGQKEYFATGVTRSYDWRVDQIDRVRQMVAGNEAALQAAMPAILRRRSKRLCSRPSRRCGRQNFRRANCGNG